MVGGCQEQRGHRTQEDFENVRCPWWSWWGPLPKRDMDIRPLQRSKGW